MGGRLNPERRNLAVDEGEADVLKFTPLSHEYTMQIKAALQHHLLTLQLV